jgi:hypothetical protein
MVLGSYVLILLVFSRPPISSEKDLEILVLGQLRGRVSSKLSAQWHMRLQQRLMAKLPTTASFSGATNYLLLWMLRIHLSCMKGLLSAITIIFCHSNSKNAAVPALQLLPLNSNQIKTKQKMQCKHGDQISRWSFRREKNEWIKWVMGGSRARVDITASESSNPTVGGPW